MAKQIKGAGGVYEKDLYGDLRKSAKETLLFLEAINKALVDTSNLAAKSLNTTVTNLKELETVNNSVVKINKAFTQKVQIDQERLKLENRLKKANSDSIQQNEEVKVLLTEQNKINKQLAREKLGLVGAYEKESKRLISLRKQYKDLALSEGETSKKARELLREITSLDTKLKGVDKTVGQSQRNVGNYSDAIGKLRGGFKSLLGAIGITTGIYAIANAFKGAFNRIREFDAELQTMAGIAGLTRKELKSVEQTIISVAGSSVKTSNDVAKLATTLFQLGKSSREVRLLLKPINDLSIALRAGTDETALFLGQTLNAFGKGAESGQEFADIVSNIASSTALDFQGLSESLAYIAPAANALGLTIGETGAILGTLNDNGVKAARSGRLMASSFSRLVNKGITLEKALEKINKSTNKVSTALDLFGSESFTLGLILADNIEKTNELGKSFDDLSEGSLKKLTDTQLISLSAEIKTADSNYEKFILSIENGEGRISNAIRGVVNTFGNLFDKLAEAQKSLNTIVKEGAETRAGQIISSIIKETKTEEEKISRLTSLRQQALKNIRDVDREIGKSRRELVKEFEKADPLKVGLITNKKFNKSLSDIDNQFSKTIKGFASDNLIKSETEILVERTESLNAANTKLGLQYKRRREEEELLLAIEEALSENVKETTIAFEGNEKAIKKTERALTGLIEKQQKVISDLQEQIQRSKIEEEIFSLGFDLDKEKEELERLIRLYTSTREEINQIEIDFIKDATERVIAQEKVKTDKLIKQIRSNSRATKEEKIRLEKEAIQKFDEFAVNEEIKKGTDAINREKELQKALFEQRRTGFKTEEEFEKEKAEQLKAIELKALNDELELLKEFGDDSTKLRQEQLKAQIQGLADMKKVELKQFTDISQALLDKFEESIAKASERRVNAIEDSISASEQQQDRLREIADKGVLGADQSLAAEEKKRAELERQKQEEIRKQELRTAGFRILSALLEQGKSPQEAIPEVGLLLGALPAIIDAIPTFIEGTEDVSKSLGKPQLKGRDGHIIRVDGKERIVDPANNARMGGVSNDEAARIVQSYNNGMLGDLQRYNHPNIDNALNMNWQTNEQILNRFESLENSLVKSNMEVKKAIENKPVLTDLGYLQMFNTIAATIQKGNNKVRTTTKLNRLS